VKGGGLLAESEELDVLNRDVAKFALLGGFPANDGAVIREEVSPDVELLGSCLEKETI